MVESNLGKVVGFNFLTEQMEMLWQLLNQTKVSTEFESQNPNIFITVMA